jgi:hypothetical protein
MGESGDKTFGPLVFLSIEILLPSLFAGALLATLAAYCNAPVTGAITTALGNTISPLVMLLLGILVYVFYRTILGEMTLYWIRHWIHDAYCRHRRLRSGSKQFVSFIALLASEVRRPATISELRFIYSDIRDSDKVFDATTRQQLDIVHATYHCLYLAAFETLGAAWYRAHTGQRWESLFWIGIVSGVAAFMADFRFDAYECRLLQANLPALRQFLQERHNGTAAVDKKPASSDAG